MLLCNLQVYFMLSVHDNERERERKKIVILYVIICATKLSVWGSEVLSSV
jgi:hypothetical protein